MLTKTLVYDCGRVRAHRILLGGFMRSTALLLLTGLLTLTAAPSHADTEGATRRQVLAKVQGSLVRIEARVRVRVERMPGVGAALARTHEVSLAGVVADAKGLILFPAAGLDPAGPAYDLIGGGGPVAVGEVRVIGAEGKIRQAEWVGRDPSSGLAAVRVDERGLAGLTPLGYGAPKPLQVGEPLYTCYLSRASFGHAPAIEGVRVALSGPQGSALTPRSARALGSLVVRPSGEAVGIVTQGQLPGGRRAIQPGAWAAAREGRLFPLAELAKLAKAPPKEAVVERDAPRARPWIGARTQPLTADLARRAGADTEVGVYVHEVYEGPAQIAGIKAGDVLLKMDGEPLDLDPGERLDDLVADYVTGEEIPFVVRRAGKNSELRVRLSRSPVRPEAADRLIVSELGLTLRELTFFDRRAAKLEAKALGAVVVEVAPDGAASRAGLRPGDLVLKVSDQELSSLQELRRLALQEGPQAFLLRRGEETLTLRVRR